MSESKERDLSGLYKMKVSHSEVGENGEPILRLAGHVTRLSAADAALALAQGSAVPFSVSEGCPECKRQDRPCSEECWAGLGEKAEEYFPAMLKLEERKRLRAKAERDSKKGLSGAEDGPSGAPEAESGEGSPDTSATSRRSRRPVASE